ncbi:MAG: NUDIX hydrolase [Acidimicrobiales bacterium]
MTNFSFAAQSELESSTDLALAAEQVTSAVSGLAGAQERTVDLLASHDSALVRSCRPGHLTGSALVVDSVGERVLLLFHSKLQKWLQPGGHADGDANLAAVALREATEETGIWGLRVVVPAIDLDIHRVDPPAEDSHEHHDLRFLVIAPPNAIVDANHESQGSQWVTAEELAKIDVDEGTRRLAAAGLAVAAQYFLA